MHFESRTKCRLGAVFVVLLAVGIVAIPQTAAQEDPLEFERVIRNAERSAPVTPYAFNGDVRDLPTPAEWQPGDPIKEIPRRFYPKPGTESRYINEYETGLDPLAELQRNFPAAQGGGFTVPSRNFSGIGFTGANPPDTVGDVGPNYYIQSTNGGTVVRIWDKATPPNQVASFNMDSLGSGVCANGLGDPIILYDRPAGRWMLSEFSSSGNNLCMYISQTGDPVSGGWHNYGFTAPSFPDYPKYGVWPTDANNGMGSYVVTANDGGPGIYAMDREPMLNGDPATFQRLTIPGLPGFGFEAPIGADMDGPNVPPDGAPAIIMRHRDTENHSGPAGINGDLLEMWDFDVDWENTANTSLTFSQIEIAEIDSDLCGLTSFFCFPQSGSGTTLDPLREVIMNRLQYYNHGTHETLVGNLVTDVDGNDTGGLRWFELRGGTGNWSLFQEGTFDPGDGKSRWMAASAMDQSGNIAIAYNVSSPTSFPSLAYTGRLADDTPGVMTQGETFIGVGTSPNSSNRYGDYSAMNLDPADDCTFWFTGMWNTSTSWRTQIASFTFEACGCELFPTAPSANAATGSDNEIDLDWNDSDLPEVVEYLVKRSRTPGGPYETIATIPDTSPGVAGGSGYFYTDNTVSGGTTYYYVVTSSDGAACKSDESAEVNAPATGACTLTPIFAGIETAGTPFTETCGLDLTWSDGTPECGGPVVYDIYRSQDPDFVIDAGSLLVSGVSGTLYSDLNSLTSGETYYYAVRARDQGNSSTDANEAKASAIPLGTLTNGTFQDDAGDTGSAKLIPDFPWSINGSEGTGGSAAYKTGNYGNLTCASLETEELFLGTGSVLSFDAKYDIENSWDKGEVQISDDGGVSWERLEVGYPGNSTNASDNCGLPTGTYFTGTGQDTNFLPYSVDLSAYQNEFVHIRFLMSSDGSVTGNGWWIDNVNITNVDVPGTCVTGSGCEDNPFVSINPGGAQNVCISDGKVLTADTVGGTPPFLYQWMRDGADIPGANSSFLDVDDTATHTYSVRVRSLYCEDDIFGAGAAALTFLDAPDFAGLQDVSEADNTTCALDLAWSPATTACSGPITYNVYRDTVSPVSVTPANLIASGVGGTTYADTDDLAEGVNYFYVVKAVDSSTGQADTNVTEQGGQPTNPNNGNQVLFFNDFEAPTEFAAWTATTGPGNHTCAPAAWTESSGAGERPTAGSGDYLISNSTLCGAFAFTSTIATSPSIDLSTNPNLQDVKLTVDMFYNHGNGDDTTVQVYDGSNWVTLWNDPNADFNNSQLWDVTAQALGNPDFRVRFSYQNAANDGWFSIDNFLLFGFVIDPCISDDTCSNPGAPAISAVNDVASCEGTGVTVDYSAGSGATRHDLYVDGILAVPGYSSGSLYMPGDNGAHTYSIRAFDQTCSTDSSGIAGTDVATGGCAGSPPPVPSLGPTQLMATGGIFSVGEIDVTWDAATCTASDYSLLYGDLANVSSVGLDGSECALGLTGNFEWSSVPSGDLFFLLVGTDGAGSESSWSTNSFGAERNGLTSSGECSVTTKSVATTCP